MVLLAARFYIKIEDKDEKYLRTFKAPSFTSKNRGLKVGTILKFIQ